jgi:hypothetical protein
MVLKWLVENLVLLSISDDIFVIFSDLSPTPDQIFRPSSIVLHFGLAAGRRFVHLFWTIVYPVLVVNVVQPVHFKAQNQPLANY